MKRIRPTSRKESKSIVSCLVIWSRCTYYGNQEGEEIYIDKMEIMRDIGFEMDANISFSKIQNFKKDSEKEEIQKLQKYV